MLARRLLGAVAIGSGVLLAGCGEHVFGEQGKRRLQSGEVLLTTSALRAIHKTPPLESDAPRAIICAEPSPDVAKALSEALSASLSAAGGAAPGVAAGVSPEAALQFSGGRAESLAQLTERIATIQLLRDGLYRACEAYANGAISKTTYSVLLSRFDDTMITMFMGELAAGNFGRSQALLTGEAAASGSASAQQEVAQTLERSLEFTDKLESLNRSEGEAAAELETAEQAEDGARKREVQRKLETIRNERSSLVSNFKGQVQAASDSSAKAGGIAAGGISDAARGGAAVAETLAGMQKVYMHNLNDDAVLVACVTALDQVRMDPAVLPYALAAGNARQGAIAGTHDEATARQAEAAFASRAAGSGSSLFAAHCLTGVLPALAASKSELLKLLLERGSSEKALATELSSVAEAAGKIEALKALLNGEGAPPE